MEKRFVMSGLLALAVAGLLSGTGLAQQHKAGDIPGPIDSIADLQDTAKMLFKMADANNDGLISQKEAVDVGNLLVGGFFFRADANGDGVLAPEEARAARDALFAQRPLLRYVLEKGKPANPPEGIGAATTSQPGQVTTTNDPGQTARSVAANPARAIGNLLDTNQDRKIEATELRQAVQSGVQTLFTMADENQDGQLSPAELNRLAGEAARTAVQSAFQTADTDRNGALSVAEFDKALTGPVHAAFRILDGNNDSQITLEELQRAEQIIVDQIRRLRVPEPSNSFRRQIQSGGTTGTQPLPVTPSPSTSLPAPGTTSRP